eukprot:4732522-Ditylum_brightwellii.AAC.1
MKSLFRIKIFAGACQANDSLLTSVLEADFGAVLFYGLTCDCDDETEIGFDECCFGSLGASYLFFE